MLLRLLKTICWNQALLKLSYWSWRSTGSIPITGRSLGNLAVSTYIIKLVVLCNKTNMYFCLSRERFDLVTSIILSGALHLETPQAHAKILLYSYRRGRHVGP